MSECKHYAYGLINNLSFMSGFVLVPTPKDIENICVHLENLKERGFSLNDMGMRHLINGTMELNADENYIQLKRIINNIQIKSIKTDRF